MLQTTIYRLNGVECNPVVICNEQHRCVAEQLRQLNKLTENIILEPAGGKRHLPLRWRRWRQNVIAESDR